MENSEQLFTLSKELQSLLSQGDASARANLLKSLKILEQISAIDHSFDVHIKECNSAIISIDEISSFANNYLQNLFFEPALLDAMRERLLLLKGLQKKYGSLEIAIQRVDDLEMVLKMIVYFDEEI